MQAWFKRTARTTNMWTKRESFSHNNSSLTLRAISTSSVGLNFFCLLIVHLLSLRRMVLRNRWRKYTQERLILLWPILLRPPFIYNIRYCLVQVRGDVGTCRNWMSWEGHLVTTNTRQHSVKSRHFRRHAQNYAHVRFPKSSHVLGRWYSSKPSVSNSRRVHFPMVGLSKYLMLIRFYWRYFIYNASHRYSTCIHNRYNLCMVSQQITTAANIDFILCFAHKTY